MVRTINATPLGEAYFDQKARIGQNVYVLQMMAAKGLRSAFGPYAKDLFKQAQKLHLTDHSLTISRELMMHYSVIVIDSGKFNYYRQQYATYMEIKQQEADLEACFFNIYHQLNLSKNVEQPIIDLIQQSLAELPMQVDSYWYNYLRKNLEVIYHEASKDTKGVLQSCNNALAYFKNLPFDTPPNVLRSFTFRKIPLLILQQEYVAAQQAIEQTKRFCKPKSHNWVITHQMQAILGFHTQQYELCLQAIQNVKGLKVAKKENWLIFEAYLYILSQLANTSLNNPLKFRLGRFLNQVPAYAKDKKGMNINILIIHILVLLKEKRWPAIVDRTEALKAYSYRHLKTDSTHRSDLFLSMLLALPKEGFQREAIERRTQKKWEALKKARF